MNFGLALEALKAGKRVARSGWNGRNMWLGLVSTEVPFTIPSDSKVCALKHPFIVMLTANYGGFVPWTASQTDILATDWEVVGDPEWVSPTEQVVACAKLYIRYLHESGHCFQSGTPGSSLEESVRRLEAAQDGAS